MKSVINSFEEQKIKILKILDLKLNELNKERITGLLRFDINLSQGGIGDAYIELPKIKIK